MPAHPLSRNDYQPPPWTQEWHRPPLRSASRGAAAVAVVGVLVAAIVTTVVLVTQGGTRTTTPAAPGTQQPPVPISTPVSSTQGPTSEKRPTVVTSTTERTTTEESTTAPRTTEPRTEPRTTPRTTAPPGDEVFVRDQREATAVARDWADAVNSGDAAAVRGLSCTQDLEAFSSGASGNRAALAGRVTLTVTSVLTARPHGLPQFTAVPALDGQSVVKSFLTRQHGHWRMCVTVTRAADL